jgi:hypothetical protein
MKPHQVREMVNELRDVAVIYSDTHQLRDRIAHVVHKYLAEPQSDLDMVGMLFEFVRSIEKAEREACATAIEELIPLLDPEREPTLRMCAYTCRHKYMPKEKNHD